MRRPKEVAVLLALLVGAVAFVLWYVADRRARQQAAPPAEPRLVGPVGAEPVDLEKVDGRTIDFSTGQPVVKHGPEDQAAIADAKKEMDAALHEVSFTPGPKPEPPKK